VIELYISLDQISRISFHWEVCCYMRTDRRTNMVKVVSTFRNSADASVYAYFFINTPESPLVTTICGLL